MAWTYSGNPSSSTRDEVRFLIGDTDTDDQQLLDAEIDYSITEATSAYGAAIISANALVAKFARLVDKAVGDLRLAYSDRLGHYQALVADLRRKRATKNATPYAGGISHDDKEKDEQNTDVVKGKFYRDQFLENGITPEQAGERRRNDNRL